MPNGIITYGGGSLSDPIPPTLSKNYVYSNVCNIVRLLSHTSGNTTVITESEVLAIVLDFTGAIQKENWQSVQPNYLQSNTYTIVGSNGLYYSDFSAQRPFIDKVINAVLLQGTNRVPIRMMGVDEFERATKLGTMFANSILGTLLGDKLQLFAGSSFLTNIEYYLTEIYYFRQPKLASITTSNYTTTYVDLPDSLIPELIDRSVLQLERTKQ